MDLNHIAFIMDGNGRWAKKRGMSRKNGHKNAEKAIIAVIEGCYKRGVKEVTLFAFSTENWNRDEDEIETIFSLIEDFFKRFKKTCFEREIRVEILGDHEKFVERGIGEEIFSVQKETENFKKFKLNIALNYGSKAEIIQGVNKAIEIGKKVTEESFSKLLYTKNCTPPDLIVRTGGEKRLSNFLLFQSAYAELHFTDVLWPDFGEEDLEKAISDYKNRDRRFGKA